MTNLELREWLSKYPDNAEVFVEASCYGREYCHLESLTEHIKYHKHYENSSRVIYGGKKETKKTALSYMSRG